jgi:hypothetical protein
MKQLSFIFLFTLAAGLFSAQGQCRGCSKNCTDSQCSDKQTAELTGSVLYGSAKETSEVKACYFHATRRCVTCQAVEAVTKEALKEYYGEKVPFQSIDNDKDGQNLLIKKFKISGPTLLIVKGDKMINLTQEAFMNARTNPDKLKTKIKSAIDSMQ